MTDLMRTIRWTREFGFQTMLEMERELWGERIGKVLLRLARKADPEIDVQLREAEAARRVAYDLVYGRIDGKEAARQFYGVYY